jgi:hypothetical protein
VVRENASTTSALTGFTVAIGQIALRCADGAESGAVESPTVLVGEHAMGAEGDRRLKGTEWCGRSHPCRPRHGEDPMTRADSALHSESPRVPTPLYQDPFVTSNAAAIPREGGFFSHGPILLTVKQLPCDRGWSAREPDPLECYICRENTQPWQHLGGVGSLTRARFWGCARQRAQAGLTCGRLLQ